MAAPGSDDRIADPHRLSRFIEAQEPVFEAALAELQAGRKRSHWMWFVFPQFRGLGQSATAQFFAIATLPEARAYLDHDLLGPRLLLCTQAVLQHRRRLLHDIFGTPDDLKFRSSMTLFEAAAEGGPKLFGVAIDQCCGGDRDPRTVHLIEAQ